jgi:bacillithiol biosynthesis cysteine-adding enzyme BshC
MDPGDERLRQLAEPLFRRELDSAPQSAALVAQKGEELIARGYHAQLKADPKAVNIFLTIDGRRTALLRRGDRFQLKRNSRTFSPGELKELLRDNPGHFSPGAALRPILQDDLLPVAAYVAGPAEVAYFAQIGPLYDHFHITRSWIYPRASLTLMESRIKELMDGLGLRLEDVWVPEDRLAGRLSHDRLPPQLEREMESALGAIGESFAQLSREFGAVEPTLQGYLRRVHGKVEHQLMDIRRKLLQAQRSRDSTVRGQAARISHHLFPSGDLQERVLNVTFFLARHGEKLLRELGPLCATPWEHLLVEI